MGRTSGLDLQSREMGRGLLAGGRSGSPGTAATTLRAAVLAPGRLGEGWNGRRFRLILETIAEISDIGDLGPAGSRAADERCPAYPIFFF
ncbi:hypothetical protein CRG98_025787 [Punica granatum]|uniref:Uncharacterized protein n=1 Tax=Punica granatum TaxID=22663 RepID=A0A2I0JBZ5_PUNGR|nr:hypothetical protein CRG98_025787 [Punica granatum]